MILTIREKRRRVHMENEDNKTLFIFEDEDEAVVTLK